MRIPENQCTLLPKAQKMRAIKQTMALITDSIGCTKCAPAQILGVPSPFSGGRIRNAGDLAFRKAMLARDMSVWGGFHISPRGAPSKGAKLCTYLRWFARPDRISTEPYYLLSM